MADTLHAATRAVGRVADAGAAGCRARRGGRLPGPAGTPQRDGGPARRGAAATRRTTSSSRWPSSSRPVSPSTPTTGTSPHRPRWRWGRSSPSAGTGCASPSAPWPRSPRSTAPPAAGRSISDLIEVVVGIDAVRHRYQQVQQAATTQLRSFVTAPFVVVATGGERGRAGRGGPRRTHPGGAGAGRPRRARRARRGDALAAERPGAAGGRGAAAQARAGRRRPGAGAPRDHHRGRARCGAAAAQWPRGRAGRALRVHLAARLPPGAVELRGRRDARRRQARSGCPCWSGRSSACCWPASATRRSPPSWDSRCGPCSVTSAGSRTPRASTPACSSGWYAARNGWA